MAKDEQSIWHRSSTVRFFRLALSKQVIRPALKTLLIGLFALAIFYGEENWRGTRAWNRYVSNSSIKPDELDLRSYIPKSVPEDDNFAANPVIKGWFVTTSRNAPFTSDRFSKAPPLLIEIDE